LALKLFQLVDKLVVVVFDPEIENAALCRVQRDLCENFLKRGV